MSETRNILVLGANGQVGTELQRCAWPQGWTIVAPDRQVLDLRDFQAIEATFASCSWNAVVNAAAYTNVDKAEDDVVAAWTVNAMAPALLAQLCARTGVPLVHVSTDYVFSGDKDGRWEIDDPPAPLNVYGASKLGGEIAVRASGARHVILRTSWVVSPHRNNFVKTILRVGKERRSIQVVSDQLGSPTSAADLARALVTITHGLVENEHVQTGTFHFSNAGAVHWADFAREIFVQSAARGGTSADVVSISSTEYPTPARRPANSLLDHAALREAYGIEPRPWQDALKDILDELIGEDL